jgi:hypothetical protein
MCCVVEVTGKERTLQKTVVRMRRKERVQRKGRKFAWKWIPQTVS